MIKNAEPFPITRIFTREAKWFYKIPMYQRAYTWGKNEWTTLFTDLVENDIGYFLGSIICVNVSHSTNDRRTDLQLIDGQQRLTSLSILLLAIYSKLKSYKDTLNENQLDKLKDIKKELVILTDEDEDNYEPRLTPQIQDSNLTDYLYLLSCEGLIDKREYPKNVGNRRILKAYKCFKDSIENYIENEDKPVKKLIELSNTVNNAVLVFIEVDSNKDAYMLFESLNNRGIPLSAIDLIKNYLVSIADDRTSSKSAEKAYNQWERIISNLGEEYSVQERFLRQYYNCFREELNSIYRKDDDSSLYPIGYLATKSTMLDIYEKLIKYDYKSLLNDLEIKAKYYSVLTNRAIEDNRIHVLEKSMVDLEHIQGAPSYLLLLYLISNMEKFKLSYNDINNMTNYLVKFFVRRNFTDYPNTRNLNKIFMDAIEKIRNSDGNNIISIICDYLTTQSSLDEEFERKLRDDVYTLNVDSTRFILCYFENQFSTKEIHTDLWERDKNNKYIWTIEHIFPEGENVPSDWVNMIANGDIEKARTLREQYTHKIGNLTLTGYNQNLSNMSFDKKMNRKDDNNNFIGYKNGLILNSDVVNQAEWHISNIEKRTDFLVKKFLEMFKL